MKRALLWVLLAVSCGLLCLYILGWQRDLDPADLQAKYANKESQFVDMGGGLIVHARDEGVPTNPAIVLVHGTISSLQTWEPWEVRLQSKYRVISFDLPGFGLTGPDPRGDYSVETTVRIIDDLTRKLGVDRFAIAGHSMGGWIAWHYALAHPERVTGQILVAPAGAPGVKYPDPPLGIRLGRSPFLRNIIMRVTPRPIIERTLRQSIADQSLVTDKMIDRYWELLLYPGNRKATLSRPSLSGLTPATREEMAQIRAPTLILWGQEDRLMPSSASHWFKSTIPGAKEIIYPRIGHVPMEETPDRSAADVDAFLGSLAPLSQK